MSNTRGVEIELGGVTLPLMFEAENLIALSELSGKSPLEYLESVTGSIRDLGEATEERRQEIGRKASNPANVLPLLMAGLAHLPEYQRLSNATLKTRVCRLIDKQAKVHPAGIIGVFANLAEQMIPAFTGTLASPGAKAKPADGENGGDRPLPEGEILTGTS